MKQRFNKKPSLYEAWMVVESERDNENKGREFNEALNKIMDSAFMTETLDRFLDSFHYAYGMGAFERVYESLTREVAFAELYMEIRKWLIDAFVCNIFEDIKCKDAVFRKMIRNYLYSALKSWYIDIFLSHALCYYPNLELGGKRIIKAYSWLRKNLSSDFSIEIADHTDEEIINMLSEEQHEVFKKQFGATVKTMLPKIRHGFGYTSETLDENKLITSDVLDMFCTRAEIDDVIDAVNALDEKSRKILQQRFFGNKQWSEIGNELAMTEGGARYICNQIIAEVRNTAKIA